MGDIAWIFAYLRDKNDLLAGKEDFKRENGKILVKIVRFLKPFSSVVSVRIRVSKKGLNRRTIFGQYSSNGNSNYSDQTTCRDVRSYYEPKQP